MGTGTTDVFVPVLVPPRSLLPIVVVLLLLMTALLSLEKDEEA